MPLLGDEVVYDGTLNNFGGNFGKLDFFWGILENFGNLGKVWKSGKMLVNKHNVL